MDFNAVLESIANVLIDSQVELRIPYYQRPYEWTVNHVNALLNDIADHIAIEGYNLEDAIGINHTRKRYLLGGIVLYRSQIQQGIHACHVIDGQQRLTSFTLICMALKIKMAEALHVALQNEEINPDQHAWYQQNIIKNLNQPTGFHTTPFLEGMNLGRSCW